MRPLLLILLALLFATPAFADDVGTAAQGVARVIALTENDDGQMASLGTAFAVSSNRVVTNAHVVIQAAQNPEGSRILVVPSAGKEPVLARIVAIDQSKDLALLEISGAAMKPMTIYAGPLGVSARVISLGYPGNVDRAVLSSELDYLTPRPPLRSSGETSGFSTVNGMNVLVHEAPISRGNSGGPVVDACGRVLGVNSAITDGDGNDSTFAFAISSTEVTAFLSRSRQSAKVERNACRTSDQRAADAKAKADSDSAAQLDSEAAEAARNRALTQERLNIGVREKRDNLLAGSFGLGLLGMLAINAAMWIATNGRRQWALGVGLAGGLLFAIAIALFSTRPSEMALHSSPEPVGAENSSP